MAGSQIATDGEIEALAPIIEAILRVVSPLHLKMFAATRAAGGSVRRLVVEEVDLDLVAVARALRPLMVDHAAIVDLPVVSRDDLDGATLFPPPSM